MYTEKELLGMKKDVEEAKTKIAELTGQEKALISQLKKDWQCNDLGDGETKLEELGDEIEVLEDEINTLSDELEKEYEEN